MPKFGKELFAFGKDWFVYASSNFFLFSPKWQTPSRIMEGTYFDEMKPEPMYE